ncbi:MAG: Pseudouridine-5'-phosphate glycosidase [Bryobacteraceae bacterium]|nr:Pseudouridine-5'-phosphate glycosidase [Bryobacteraceae bacterium]
MNRERIVVAPGVQEALGDGAPVVALESTIIAHGMPYPENVETALAVERIVRSHGAVPATLGVVAGEVVAGLTAEQIELFGTDREVEKAGERELPLVVARKAHAAVTAGASIAIAGAVGIRVFVTGGIGGVGPLASKDFDISADLQAIAAYSVITVCAGTKAFMDVPATLEYLETMRTPVATWRAAEFPLFYSRRSGVKSPWVAREAGEIARAFDAKMSLGMNGGILVAVPVPEEEALPEEETRGAIDKAMARIREAAVTGKAVTPFLLNAIREETGGRSLQANVALIRNNARVGAEIAAALSRSG